jgi:hypothetical protein
MPCICAYSFTDEMPMTPLMILLLAARMLLAGAVQPSTAPTTAPAPSDPFELTDSRGVVRRPLAEHAADAKAVAFIFIAVDCPISNGYAPEINRIIADYTQRGVAFYLVYADPTVTAAAVTKHASDFGYTCPALLDPQHVLVRKVGATVTPEAAVFSPGGGTPLYRGRIDDLYLELGKKRFAPTTHDLRDALDAIMQGRPVTTPVTRAIGCDL